MKRPPTQTTLSVKKLDQYQRVVVQKVDALIKSPDGGALIIRGASGTGKSHVLGNIAAAQSCATRSGGGVGPMYPPLKSDVRKWTPTVGRGTLDIEPSDILEKNASLGDDDAEKVAWIVRRMLYSLEAMPDMTEDPDLLQAAIEYLDCLTESAEPPYIFKTWVVCRRLITGDVSFGERVVLIDNLHLASKQWQRCIAWLVHSGKIVLVATVHASYRAEQHRDAFFAEAEMVELTNAWRAPRQSLPEPTLYTDAPDGPSVPLEIRSAPPERVLSGVGQAGLIVAVATQSDIPVVLSALCLDSNASIEVPYGVELPKGLKKHPFSSKVPPQIYAYPWDRLRGMEARWVVAPENLFDDMEARALILSTVTKGVRLIV